MNDPPKALPAETAGSVSYRSVVNTRDLVFRPYDRYGKVTNRSMWWHPVSFDNTTGEATFFLRLDPGYRGGPHEHVLTEQFLVLEGELIDPDNRAFKAGDFVSYRPASRHWSHSPGGCTLLVFVRAFNRTLGPDEVTSLVD
jgi:mannose-6-phosphate isomerase-like protein (cupin superfamily)